MDAHLPTLRLQPPPHIFTLSLGSTHEQRAWLLQLSFAGRFSRLVT